MIMNIEEAKNLVEAYLRKSEEEINKFGSALPDHENLNIKLVILEDKIEEYEFGWVFYYNSEMFIKTGDYIHALAGNTPLIVDRKTKEIIVTGTAHKTEFYINNYKKHGNPHYETK